MNSLVEFGFTEDQLTAVQAMGYQMVTSDLLRKPLKTKNGAYLWLVRVAYPQQVYKWTVLLGGLKTFDRITHSVPEFDDILSAAVFCETMGEDVT